MWKAKINAVENDEKASVARVTIEYFTDDGKSKVVVERISEVNSIRQIVLNGLKELERQEEVANFIQNPPLGEISFEKVINEEEENKSAFAQKVSELQVSKNYLELGLITQSEYDIKLSEVKSSK